jgi:hypothetical protein
LHTLSRRFPGLNQIRAGNTNWFVSIPTAFPQGKYDAETEAITSAAEAAAKESAEVTYTMRICDGTNDGQPDAISRDLSDQKVERFTVDLRPGCFSGFLRNYLLRWGPLKMQSVNSEESPDKRDCRSPLYSLAVPSE